MPASIAATLFGLGVLPYAPLDIVDDFHDLSLGERSALIGLAGVLLGFVLYALQSHLHRLLEGHYLPRRVQEARKSAQRAKAKAFSDQHRSAVVTGAEAGRWQERRWRWPQLESEIVATRYGNAIRSFEIYGSTHFRLDAMSLWYELEALAPPHLRAELERARTPADFCVSALYLSAICGALALLMAVIQHDDRLFLLCEGLVLLGLVPFWYWAAIASTSEWREVSKALVNIGRPRLAEALGLRLPATLDEERLMWNSVTRLVQGRETDDDLRVLDTFRNPPPTPPPPPEAATAAYSVVTEEQDRTHFELRLGDDRLVAMGDIRDGREAVLQDIALVRSIAARTPLHDAPATARSAQTPAELPPEAGPA